MTPRAPAESRPGVAAEPAFDPPYLEHLARLGAADLHPAGRRGSARLERALALGRGQRVLEIGCGTGQTLARLASTHRVTLVGVDRMQPMLATARRRLGLAGLSGRVPLARADAVHLPFEDASFDRVYMESVLGFQTEARARLVLRRTGRFVANEAVWRLGTTAETVSSIHDRSVDDFGLAQASGAGWTHAQWTRCMRESGFALRASEALDAERDAGRNTGRPWRGGLRRIGTMLASRALTLAYRLRATLSPELARQKREYRLRLGTHREDGRHIEAYLFVLEPDSGGGP
jgi:SAM-dependent methyltransferase